ncbi:MAG: DUF2851 family protein [Verrucomicrobia subdivision 3 bacterium]|nr:DUF2851 family protein [Limisphaerales bacterium]
MNRSNFYAEWRLRCSPSALLREDRAAPPERLLQAIWMHQRLLREKLVTLDGRRVEVLHPGFWNREPGPDFRGAVLRIGAELPRSGDVEIDLQSSGWKGHGHDSNPAFQNVALHVVWEGDGRSQRPTLVLKEFLDSPLNDLTLWLGRDGAEPPSLAGQCSAPLKELADAQLNELLNQAAFVRFQAKAKHLQARAREAGWEQSLWEGLFRALGYKHNVWPMQRLAELRPLVIQHGGRDAVRLEARLLGIAGLLPADMTNVHRSAAAYLRQLWDYWWRERDDWFDHSLPKSMWRFAGLRPANMPQRRIALAARWLANEKLLAGLDRWSTARPPERELLPKLLKVWQANDDFWSWRWSWRTARLASAQPLLGPARLTDMAVNVILPWIWSRAAESANQDLQREIEQRFYRWPAGEDNVLLRLARRRLLDNSAGRLPARAALQQGLLQIVRDFCEQSNALCQNCRFPELVKAWPGENPGSS